MRDGFGLDVEDGVQRVTGLPGWEEWTFVVTPATSERSASLTVEAPTGTDIDPDRWRRIPIGTVLAMARTAQSRPAMAAATRSLGSPPKRPHGGSDAHRARVVEVYRMAVANGWSPAELVADYWRLRDAKTASVWIKECRDHGQLGSFADERRRSADLRDKHVGRSRGRGSTPRTDAWGVVPSKKEN